MYLPRPANENRGRPIPENDNHKRLRRRKEPTPEITAYPRDYPRRDESPSYRYGLPVYTTAYLRRLGWCMECKENPCECIGPGDEWIDPD